ncbi:hypothetical protein TREMEDRAFT_62281 [Tremella mesenterica DSM 1558]|uniref:uncharacterized protein n=1 Tax=Tremella mesenterica (strain ATCC 24925 / CBS 8224 / DSM 1558 / NBRC 9311 / NRRL Y-6157 / RJB 2259-6 / UBC 559-6) TaxID=578456 RepID=UPI0003F49126|nr:uncharacterized protein TREMEDRAFT_62281 [Tremella mesenterica DSM 1558]EIW69415.1 hypothetical protein TREMEDRAFT_62281 [Tremella mesenterica DSM 1558]
MPAILPWCQIVSESELPSIPSEWLELRPSRDNFIGLDKDGFEILSPIFGNPANEIEEGQTPQHLPTYDEAVKPGPWNNNARYLNDLPRGTVFRLKDPLNKHAFYMIALGVETESRVPLPTPATVTVIKKGINPAARPFVPTPSLAVTTRQVAVPTRPVTVPTRPVTVPTRSVTVSNTRAVSVYSEPVLPPCLQPFQVLVPFLFTPCRVRKPIPIRAPTQPLARCEYRPIPFRAPPKSLPRREFRPIPIRAPTSGQ